LVPVPLTAKAISNFAESRKAQDEKARKAASEIVADVRSRGFEAVAEYSRKFDGFLLSPGNAAATKKELAMAEKSLSLPQRAAMLKMKARVESFARLQMLRMGQITQKSADGKTTLKFIPLQRVGIYVPAGRAPLFSSLFMAAVPAQVAGVSEIIICTPPQKDGNANSLVLAAAKMCSIPKVYKMGGAQAIAAMAYGIEGMVAPADIICGPGSAYVNAAKQIVAGEGVRIDVPAGPSEALVIADVSANPAFVAADMLAQAEHGGDSAAICICDSGDVARGISAELSRQLACLPAGSPARSSIQKWGRILVAKGMDAAIDAANSLAPEHLELLVKDAARLLPLVKNAGAVFINTGEAFCDYGMGGGNHILPTNFAAKAWGGVSVQSFGKWMYAERLSVSAQKRLAKDAALLARMEGLEAHARAAEARNTDGCRGT
jgi:histidinol dehydrogenase